MEQKIHTKKTRHKRVSYLAAGTGFEPVQSESESLVLPLHHPAIYSLGARDET